MFRIAIAAACLCAASGCARPKSTADVWTFHTKRPWILAGDSSMYSPVVKDDTVFFCGGYSWNSWSELHALTAGTGESHWHVPVGRCQAPPLPVGSMVVAFADSEHGDKYTLYGVEAASGRTVWRYDLTPPSVWQTFRAALGEFVYLTSFRGPVRRVNAATGSIETIPLGQDPGDPHWLAADGGRVIVGARESIWIATGAGPLAPGPALQSAVRRVDSAVADGDLLVLGDRENNSLTAFSLTDGQVRWSRRWKGLQSAPLIAGDRVFVNAITPKFELQALDATSGKPVWSAGDGGFDPPAVDEGRVYASGRTSVFVINANSGQVTAQIPTTREVITSPVHYGGLVIFGTIDGVLHAAQIPAYKF